MQHSGVKRFLTGIGVGVVLLIGLAAAAPKYLYQGMTDPVTLANTTASTTKDTGAVIIEGGLGVEGAVYVGADVVADSDGTPASLVGALQSGNNLSDVDSPDDAFDNIKRAASDSVSGAVEIALGDEFGSVVPFTTNALFQSSGTALGTNTASITTDVALTWTTSDALGKGTQFLDGSGGDANHDITLPSAADAARHPFLIVNAGATGTLQVSALSVVLDAQGESVVVASDGTNWWAFERLETVAAAGGSKLIQQWNPWDYEPAATNSATPDLRNRHQVLDFDTTTGESAVFSGVLKEGVDLSGGVTVFVQWAATSATTGTIGWTVAFERIASAGIDLDADGFGTAQTITAATVSGTSGITIRTSVNFSQAQLPTSLAAGDAYRVKLDRDVASDNAGGDAELVRFWWEVQ